MDLREPNKSVVIDCHPLPHIEELFAEMRNGTVFSQIDLANAYHQLPLHKDSINLTAFITHDGLFRYKRVPFGLASAPSAFQKMMQTVLKDLMGVQNYLDDIVVWGSSKAEHNERLRTVLQRLVNVGLRLNFEKSTFNQPSIRYLGHIISKDGLCPNPDHIKAISDAPAPADLQALRSFLDLTSWFNKLIPNYATVVEPLRKLLQSGADTFKWTVEAQESFKELKGGLVHSAPLTLFDPSLKPLVSLALNCPSYAQKFNKDGQKQRMRHLHSFLCTTLYVMSWRWTRLLCSGVPDW